MLKREEKQIGYSSRGKPDPRNIEMYIDEYDRKKDNDNILFLCLALIEDYVSIENSLQQLHKELRQDPFLSGNQGVLDKGFLLWNDLPESARDKLVEKIGGLPFRAYVACTKYIKNYRKEDYFTLFQKLLKPRFDKHDGNNISLKVDINTIFKEYELQEISDKIYSMSEKNALRRPLKKPRIEVCSKKQAL